MGYGYGPNWGMMSGWGYGYVPVHLVVWIIILIAIVAFCAWMMRSVCMPGARHAMPQRSPGLEVLEELEERYARGEINRDEYLQKKQDILGN